MATVKGTSTDVYSSGISDSSLPTYYNEACVVTTSDAEAETRDTKKAKAAATTV